MVHRAGFLLLLPFRHGARSLELLTISGAADSSGEPTLLTGDTTPPVRSAAVTRQIHSTAVYRIQYSLPAVQYCRGFETEAPKTFITIF